MIFSKALEIAINAHHNVFDKCGEEYIKHPLAVYALVVKHHGDSNTQIAAILHDVVEDTDITFDDILDEGIPDVVVDALKLLTRPKEKHDYFEYIQNLSSNPIARLVKMGDLTHNSKTDRIPVADRDDEKKMSKWKKKHEKYNEMYQYLLNIDNKE